VTGWPRLLVLVRHAESARNVVKGGEAFLPDGTPPSAQARLADHLVPLTAAGHEHARRTGEAIRDRFGAFDAVCSSGYARADQTAAGIAAAYLAAGLDFPAPVISPLLRERDAGYCYGMTRAEAVAAFPWLDEHWRQAGGFFGKPPGGESMADVVGRAQAFLGVLGGEQAGRTVLAVTHGGTIRALRFLLERWDYATAEQAIRDGAPANCGLAVYRYGDGAMRLEEFNRVY